MGSCSSNPVNPGSGHGARLPNHSCLIWGLRRESWASWEPELPSNPSCKQGRPLCLTPAPVPSQPVAKPRQKCMSCLAAHKMLLSSPCCWAAPPHEGGDQKLLPRPILGRGRGCRRIQTHPLSLTCNTPGEVPLPPTAPATDGYRDPCPQSLLGPSDHGT